jgi:hypothetical protein
MRQRAAEQIAQAKSALLVFRPLLLTIPRPRLRTKALTGANNVAT